MATQHYVFLHWPSIPLLKLMQWQVTQMCWHVVEMYAKSGNKNANLSFLQNRKKQNKQKGRPARTETQSQHLHAWKARRGRSSPALTGPPEGMQGRKGEEEIRYEKCLRDRQQKQKTQGRVRWDYLQKFTICGETSWRSLGSSCGWLGSHTTHRT